MHTFSKADLKALELFNVEAPGSSTYSFCPVTVSDGYLSLYQTRAWTMDVKAGNWMDRRFERVPATDSTTDSDALNNCENSAAKLAKQPA